VGRHKKESNEIVPGTLYLDDKGSPFIWTRLIYPFEYSEEEAVYDVHYVKMGLPLLEDGIAFIMLDEKEQSKMTTAQLFNTCWDSVTEFADEKFNILPFPTDCIALAGHDNINGSDGNEISKSYFELISWASSEAQKLNVKVEGNSIQAPTHVWGKTHPSTSLIIDSNTKDRVSKIYIRPPRAVEAMDDQDNPNKLYALVKFYMSLVYKIETESGKNLDGKVFNSSVSLKKMSLVDAFLITRMISELEEAINSFRHRPATTSNELLQESSSDGERIGSNL
jgi:hypothetical protein